MKKNHPYYCQMHLQMLVRKLAKINFFILSRANGGSSGLYGQARIDNQFLQSEIFPKFLRYFQNIFLPEIMTRKLDPDFENCRKLYCCCQGARFKKMIGCDNSTCEKMCLHYNGVRTRRAPMRKWFCSRECEKNVRGSK